MLNNKALMTATVTGTAVQLLMVIAGHWLPAVAAVFGPLGTLISVGAGVMYARRSAQRPGAAAVGGLISGGVCALIGILVSFGLGDVTAPVLAFGTAGSAVAGAVGAVITGALRRRASAPS